MALNLSDLAYPFDPTGSLASNLITNEQQILTAVNWTDYQFVVPRYAPMFDASISITITDAQGNTTPLLRGKDWYPCFEFISASRACAAPIWGGIQFLNPLLAGVLKITYQTLGGIWTLDMAGISALLADRSANPRITAWEQVVDQPVMFPVIDHEWDLVDMVGMTDIVTALGGIETMLRQTGTSGLAAHLADYTNPHRVTAAQVGLGNVQNFGIAQAADLAAGSSNTVYMTPAGVTTMVNAGVGASLTSHINNTQNPHGTTASQVGAYSKAEVDALLAGYQPSGSSSADTELFDGMDATTYRDWALSTGVAANSLEFGGLTPSQYSAQVLAGTAANATKAFGLTQAQLTSTILSGTAANAAAVNGMNPADFAAWVLQQGTATNSLELGGMTPAQLAVWIQANSVASNSNQLGGLTLQQVLAQAQASGSYTVQGVVTQDAGLAAGTWWQNIVQMILPDGVTYTADELNDSHWIVTIGGAGGTGLTSAYYVYATIKDGSPTYGQMNSVCLTPNDIGVTFGFLKNDIDHGTGTAVPTFCVFAKGTEQMGAITVNALATGAKEIYVTTDQKQNTEPAGITYAAADRFALESEVTQVLDSLTTMFQSLATQISS